MQNVPDEFRGHGDVVLLKLIAEEIERGEYPPYSTFRRESMLYVFRKFRVAFGPMYSDRYLKSKIKSFRKRYHQFSQLLSQDGIRWNQRENVVYGNETLLREQYKAHYKGGVYHGEEYYDLLSNIFKTGIKYE